MLGRTHARPARVRTATAVAALLAGGALLAACSSPPPAPRASTTTSSTATTTTSPTSSGTTSPSSSTATTGPGAVPACASGALTLAEDVAKSSTSAGSADIAFTLTSTASTPCSMMGYPVVTFSSAPGSSGKAVALATRDTGPSPARVTLDAHAVAAFYLVVGNVPVGGVGCVSVGAIDVLPPGGGSPLSVAASFSACGPSVGVTAIEPLASLST